MIFDSSRVVRKPRHSVDDKCQSAAWVEFVDPQQESVSVELIDFSRQGAQLKASVDVPPHAQLNLHIQDSSAGFGVSLPGKVCWQRAGQNGSWMIGCPFDEVVSYEIIGELFLTGILSTD